MPNEVCLLVCRAPVQYIQPIRSDDDQDHRRRSDRLLDAFGKVVARFDGILVEEHVLLAKPVT